MKKVAFTVPALKFSFPKLTIPSAVIRIGRLMLLGLAGIITILVMGVGIFLVVYSNRIYPRTMVGSVSVNGMTQAEAQQQLTAKFQNYIAIPIILTSNNRTWKLEPQQLGLSLDASSTAQLAYRQGRGGSLVNDAHDLWRSFARGTTITPKFMFDSAAYNSQLTNIVQALDVPPQSSKISYVDDQFVVAPSITGMAVDNMKLSTAIRQHISTFATTPIAIPVQAVQPALTAERAQQIVPSLTQYVNEPLELVYGDKKLTLDVATLVGLINYDKTGGDGFSLSQGSLHAYIDSFAEQIDRPAKDALFQFQDGKVTAFQASQDGLAVDQAALSNALEKTLLAGGPRVITVPVKVTQAFVTTESVNNLGIEELLGHGESNYRGSPQDRIFNLTLATSRLNGTLVAPGQEFSFNQTVGEISQATGYRQALVILSGRTALGDGGGVCQVSTTLFRSILNSGLPVTARTAHAYRVGYYENDAGPGLDATIYQPGVDLRFKNDTDHYILIQAVTDPLVTKINIDIYGTSDGRVATVSRPVILSTTPAPPDVHQPDPTLPVGTSKQVEHSIPGAKTIFYRKVVRDGQTIINESFTSNFVPWAAVFLDGTKTS